jgi:hypothetical protein
MAAASSDAFGDEAKSAVEVGARAASAEARTSVRMSLEMKLQTSIAAGASIEEAQHMLDYIQGRVEKLKSAMLRPKHSRAIDALLKGSRVIVPNNECLEGFLTPAQWSALRVFTHTVPMHSFLRKGVRVWVPGQSMRLLIDASAPSDE